MPNKLNLIGRQFGRLSVTAPARNIGRWTAWNCRCECGESVVVLTTNLRRRVTRSCGCLHRQRATQANTTHGRFGTRLYWCWNDMRQRCSNPRDVSYRRYGGRGISFCDEWQEFEPFMEWALANGYADDLSIDRIDNAGDYEPDNCRWATRRAQANNTRRNRLIAHAGETKTLKQWARSTGINYGTLRGRFDRGWSAERALTKRPAPRKSAQEVT